MTGPRFALHPDFIIADDGDEHYIGTTQLARLYQLRPGEYVVVNWRRPETFLGRDLSALVHLHPRADGKYGRPE